MTTEQQAVLIAAKVYVIHGDERTLGNLITAVENLPLSQWPANACPPVRGELSERYPMGWNTRYKGNASDDLEGIKC